MFWQLRALVALSWLAAAWYPHHPSMGVSFVTTLPMLRMMSRDDIRGTCLPANEGAEAAAGPRSRRACLLKRTAYAAVAAIVQSAAGALCCCWASSLPPPSLPP